MSEIESVWEGVFDSFAEAGGDGSMFLSDEWVKKNRDRALEALSSPPASKEYPLSVLMAMLLQKPSMVRVLDYGGGMGLQYIDIIKKIPNVDGLEYHLLENSKILDGRPESLSFRGNLRFHKSLDTVPKERGMNVIHFGSVLQYIEDYKDLIRVINSKFSPEYFVFSDLMVGDVPEFVTHQISYDKKIPVRIVNIDNFKKFMEVMGFRLIYEAKFIAQILGQDEVYPNQGLPDGYRIDRASNFIFSRKNKC